MAWEWLPPAGTVAASIVGTVGLVAVSVRAAAAGRQTQVDVAKVQADAALTKTLLDEKRALYAKFLGLADTARNKVADERKRKAALVQLVGHDEPDGDEVELEGETADVEWSAELNELLTEMSGLRMQIMILSGPEMARKAGDLFAVVRDFARRKATESDVEVELVAVGDAMHVDATQP
ncbi:hypothetical protein AB0K35_06490 [Micromonospora sp. NPDC053740]|uniref:hypothetical protein n=1 Tax=Micromonospora sp. NPDC053740 TaxID=3155173 RepID=UPI003447684E